MKLGSRYGLHRVIEPRGAFPQGAWKLNPHLPLAEDEMLIQIEALHIDSASFKQLKDQSNNDEAKLQSTIQEWITERGKMHNPVTGSGGMLIGKVDRWGSQYPTHPLRTGDRIATLVSLTLTPLNLESIDSIDMKTGQIRCTGHAILFASGLWAPLPEDLPLSLSLAVMDVCGAPAQTAKRVQPGMTVLLLGAGGKSGMLSLMAARDRLGTTGRLIALEYGQESIERLRRLDAADDIIAVDCTDPVEVMTQIHSLTAGLGADLTINCVNVPGTEMSSIMATRDGGMIYFFSMATSFTAAALGAEGVGKDVEMVIGNGYTPGHWEYAIQLVRDQEPLYRELMQSYGK
jgi:L-erythro-3,5-diaminohexanoate dehydrogenase